MRPASLDHARVGVLAARSLARSIHPPRAAVAMGRYVGVGLPSKADGASLGTSATGGADGEAGGSENASAMSSFGVAAGERVLQTADCSPVRAWAYLIGALPNVSRG